MNILFDNSTSYNFDSNLCQLMKSVIIEALKLENISENAEISISIVDNAEIKEINKKYRNIDKETDVLSFPLIDFENESILENDDFIVLGDIIISIDKVISQANEYGHTFERELGFLIAHSMLHLLGYDHMEEDEEKEMFEKQEVILNNLNLKR